MTRLRQPHSQVSSCSGQLVDDLDAWQIRRQRLAPATALGRSDGFFLGFFGSRFRRCFDQFLGLVEHRQLRGVVVSGAALGLWRKQLAPQQGDLLLKLGNASIFCRRLLIGQQQ